MIQVNDFIKSLNDMYEKYSRQYEINEYIEGGLAIIGDSLVYHGNFKKYFSDLFDNIYNLGIPGDTTKGVIKRLHVLKKVKPKAIILHIGSNDYALYKSNPKDILKNIDLIKQQILSILPNVDLYIVEMTPVLLNHEKSNELYIMERTNDMIMAFNKEINNYYQDTIQLEELWYNMELNSAYTNDGIHLNTLGYTHYMEKIKRKFKGVNE